MTDATLAPDAAGQADPARTPAGLQRRDTLFRRRLLVAALNLGSLALIGSGIASVLGGGGWTATDALIFAAFLIGAPWTVMGFWNAVIGLWLLHGARDPLAAAAPQAHDDRGEVRERTALLMFLRNEDPERALARLATLKGEIDRAGAGALFDVFVLSDTSLADVAEEEERVFARARALLGPGAVYRRRVENTGWKAGNVRDWLLTRGAPYTFYLPLDSDSLMSGEAVLRMVRVMQNHPRLGILQSLIVGTPSDSAFARIFQFGMRHGMRSYTMGASWWHGDCGPYWGHNALIRTAPFTAHCELPVLPGRPPLGGHILSHDQLEAALMRRAGWEVRVLPVEGESWEDNPVTLLDFTRRDLRWCNGNMQYWRFLLAKGLLPMSRFQIFAAIMMYFGAPAWMLMTGAAAWKIAGDEAGGSIDFALGLSMFFVVFAVSLFPKIAGWIDIALRPGGTAAYGGSRRFALGALAETLFSMMLAPAVAFRVSLFMIGLLFGRRIAWNGQSRDARALGWGEALRGLWPQTLFGLGLAALVLTRAPAAFPWALPVLAGLALAIPFAVATASPAFGRFAVRSGLCAIPDEASPHPALAALSGRLPERAARLAAE